MGTQSDARRRCELLGAIDVPHQARTIDEDLRGWQIGDEHVAR
jgi:hypothetical protein